MSLLTDILRDVNDRIRVFRAIAALTGGTFGVDSINVTVGGSNYTVDFALILTGGGGAGADFTMEVVDGEVVSATRNDPGSSYNSEPTLDFSNGDGVDVAASVVMLPLCLDSVATLAMDVGTLAVFAFGGQVYFYQLTAGTDAEAAPWVVRPDDYASSTNEKVWKLIRAETAGEVTPCKTLSWASTTDLDFSGPSDELLVDLGGNTTFTTSNRGADRKLRIKIKADGSTRNFTFPAWIFVGGAAPASIAAGKTGWLELRCYDGTDANTIAKWSVQP